MYIRSVVASIGLAAVFHAGVSVAQMPPAKVVVVEAKMLEAPATITLVGTVDAVRRSRVGSEISGIVAQMPARQGDFVERGHVLCKLRDDALSLRLAEATASLDALKERHSELVAGTRKQELTRLKAVLDEAVAENDRWKFEMGRIEKLYEGSVSNAKEYADTRAEFLSAERRNIAAQARYDLGVAGPRKEVIARAAYEVAEQQAVVDRIASDLSKTEIRAPFSGYVTDRVAEVGEWVSVGGQVVEMVDLSSVLVRVEAPESALPYLVVGASANAKIDALKKTFAGRIKHTIRQADERARTFPVEIEIDNSEQLLASGMFARATVPAGAESSVVAVPKDAIVERQGLPNVAMLMPGEHGGLVGMLTPVSVGTDVGDWIAITSGNITAGTQVITRGNENILPFPTPVIVVDEKGTPVAPPEDDVAAVHRRDE